MKVEHLGRKLTKSMTKYGSSITFISHLIGITRPTLYTRLKDGKFTEKQIEILQEAGFL